MIWVAIAGLVVALGLSIWLMGELRAHALTRSSLVFERRSHALTRTTLEESQAARFHWLNLYELANGQVSDLTQQIAAHHCPPRVQVPAVIPETKIVREYRQILAALAVQQGGELRITQAERDAIPAWFGDRTDEHGTLVIRVPSADETSRAH